MGLFSGRNSGAAARAARVARLEPDPDPVWITGTTEVQIVGETFHASAIKAAETSSPPGSRMRAELIPEPDNPHDPNAVGVYLSGYHAGYISREIAPAVTAAIDAFTAAHNGHRPSCPAEVIWHDQNPQVILYLDPAWLGLQPSLFDWVPESARVIGRALAALDQPAPRMTGCDQAGRDLLAAAEALRVEVDADFDRGPERWPQTERAFLAAAKALEASRDPLAAEAWVGVARSVRFQKGRRDSRIFAAITALYWERASRHGWAELVDAASAAPHVPTLLDIFGRVPAAAREPVLTKLIALSRGRDRLGNMHPEAGSRLRAGLLAIATADGDNPSITKLGRDARRHAGS